mmetsp:Transcript_23660/g.54731  ORF Transcript_23660/g.54731 Transcript_23660/m.54731 type:complete len:102 (+) Transcript_23660:169-474(+)
MLHLWFRVGYYLDGGAVLHRLSSGERGESSATNLEIALGVAAPALLGFGVVFPLVILLPMHAANEKVGGFNEVKQFQLYLGTSAIYAALTFLFWLVRTIRG